MIQQVLHETTDTIDTTAPAGVTLARAVAKELHGPAHRAPEAVAVPQLMGLRTSAERLHRHKVPLRRITAVAA
ncbi:hypothetical protein ACIOC2_32880 [Streptomyces sp. NPDC088337]|uniref:hypothetical protein n=1 Tax=unclassified Streptomyces TaxID=2593676 RepID=UPI000C27CC3B|nr:MULTISPECIES: hypothetical protein [unclassified Streptomyces]PJM95177.1 hypothetical protein CG719_14865 [Streptomyces sp. CB01373]WSB27490.1 hypothetical protein OIE49_17175 [Streptomyces sp. NBC_01788]